LFADIKGSTELMEGLDPEEARAIIDPALKLMIDAVHRYDGYVVQSTGDAIFALFGAPMAHEDHPQRALYAALRMQEELVRYSTKVVADGSSPIQGRVGVNTGEVVVRSITTGVGQTEYSQSGIRPTLPRECRLWRRSVQSQLARLPASFVKATSSSNRSARPKSKASTSGQHIRSDRVGTAADSVAAFAGTRSNEVRRTRARDEVLTGTQPNHSTSGLGQIVAVMGSRGLANPGCSSSSRRHRNLAGRYLKRFRFRTARR
jgi:Adenylate and Guanylate cyclase catalytic domain